MSTFEPTNRHQPIRGDCAFAGRWLRQSVENCTLCAGQRPHAERRCLETRLGSEKEFDRVVGAANMVHPYVAKTS